MPDTPANPTELATPPDAASPDPTRPDPAPPDPEPAAAAAPAPATPASRSLASAPQPPTGSTPAVPPGRVGPPETAWEAATAWLMGPPPGQPPRRPGQRSRWWPGPATAAGPVPMIAAVGAGVFAAIMVPLGHIGIGWALAGLTTAAAVIVSLARPASTGDSTAEHADAGDTTAEPGDDRSPVPAKVTAVPARHRWESVAWGLAALALLSVGAFRAADWLFGLCLFGVAVAVTMAVTGGRAVRGMVLGAMLVPAASWRGVAWARHGLSGLRHTHSTARLGATVAVTVAVLVLFGALLASADAAFSRVLGTAMPDLAAGSVLRWIVLFGAGGTLTLGVVFLLLAPPTMDAERTGGRRVRLIEWAVPVGALVALFASFLAVQVTVLFGGSSYVREADGLTYAQHARGGFWQLLAVTVLTLLVIGVVARLAPRGTPVEWWCLRGLLGALAVLSLAIVASALFRMHTYQEAYGFTRLRVLVSVVELWLGLVFLLVLAAGVRLRAGWLPRAVAATGIVALLALAVLNPDRFIAERNLDRWHAGEQLDVVYLGGLSADAVPALVCLPLPERGLATARIRQRLAESPDDWRRANLAVATARSQLAGGPTECAGR